jgi:hypothetical protein
VSSHQTAGPRLRRAAARVHEDLIDEPSPEALIGRPLLLACDADSDATSGRLAERRPRSGRGRRAGRAGRRCVARSSGGCRCGMALVGAGLSRWPRRRCPKGCGLPLLEPMRGRQRRRGVDVRSRRSRGTCGGPDRPWENARGDRLLLDHALGKRYACAEPSGAVASDVSCQIERELAELLSSQCTVVDWTGRSEAKLLTRCDFPA